MEEEERGERVATPKVWMKFVGVSKNLGVERELRSGQAFRDWGKVFTAGVCDD